MRYQTEPEIEWIGNRPVEGALGLTDLKKGKIYVSTFDDVLRYTKDEMREWFQKLANRFSTYILRHEYFVEWNGRPENEEQHAILEAVNLENSLDCEDGLVGLAYHKIGLERDQYFSKTVAKYFDIEGVWRMAKQRYGQYIDDLKAGIEVLLGLRSVEYV